MSHRSPLEQAHAQALFLAQQLLPNPLDHPRYEFVRYLKNDSSHHGFFTALAKDKELDARVILKFLPRKKALSKTTEHDIIQHFKQRHPHLISLDEVFLTDEYLVLVMEYADNGDLFNLVMSLSKGLPEFQCRLIFHQLMLAVDFCHRMGVVNREIQLENIFLVGRLVKLGDFRLFSDERQKQMPMIMSSWGSSSSSSSMRSSSSGSSIVYTAPEILLSRSSGSAQGLSSFDRRKADLWSCGVVLYAMLTSSFPFSRPNDASLSDDCARTAVIQRILAGEYSPVAGISEGCATLLRGLLEIDPGKRLTVQHVFHHPWFLQNLSPGVLQFNERICAEMAASAADVEETLQEVQAVLAQSQKGAVVGVRPVTVSGSSGNSTFVSNSGNGLW